MTFTDCRRIAAAMKPYALLLLVGALLFSACSSEDSAVFKDDSKLPVVATSQMVTDMVRVIGGERTEVYGMMGAAVDPHSYQTTFGDAVALKQAKVVFYSGLHLEGRMQEALEGRKAKGEPVFAVTDALSKEQLLQPQEDFDGYSDPHVWGDPSLWVHCIDEVVRGLIEVDAEGAEYYNKRADEYRAELVKLHQWASQRVAQVPVENRILVTSHDAFFYFGQAYGFEVRGLQGISTASAKGLKDRKELVNYIREKKLKMIFPESSVNPKDIEAAAKEAGVKISEHELFSDAMGEDGDVVELHGESYDKGTYIGMIKHNVNSIVDGLK